LIIEEDRNIQRYGTGDEYLAKNSGDENPLMIGIYTPERQKWRKSGEGDHAHG